MAADSESLPTRSTELLVVSIVMFTLNTLFTTWRIIVRYKSRRTGTSDWLMIVGAAMCNAGIAVAIVSSFHGAGRLLRDPFWANNTEAKMAYQNQLSFASQMLNIYGIFAVKLSICAYLLILDFSPCYKRVIWGTVVFITIFNFILPVILHFGSCRNFASGWDVRVKDKQCWPQLARTSIATAQSISNIISDLVYATAPIVYIRSIQLSSRVQWSVRAVFLMSLLCTAISSLKLRDYFRVSGLEDPYYESVTLSIWSITEVSVGIVVANLPPLRKSFDAVFRRVFPCNEQDLQQQHVFGGPLYESGEGAGGMELPVFHRGARSRECTEDGESDKGILTEMGMGMGMENKGISKRTDIVVVQQPRGKDEW